LKSKGNPITCYIELAKGNDLKNIRLNSIELKMGEDLIAKATGPNKIGDYDKDNIPDLMVKFDRQTVIKYLKDHNLTKGKITLAVVGQIGDKIFAGIDSIKVIPLIAGGLKEKIISNCFPDVGALVSDIGDARMTLAWMP
jgi:hypothetical protein